MKEYKNLKDLKQSNVLVSIYVDNLEIIDQLKETFYSISKQTYPVDLFVFHNLSEEDTKILQKILDKPSIIIRENKDDKLVEKEQVSDGKINYVLSKQEFKSFPRLFNETFNVANNYGYDFMSIIEKYDIVGLNWFKVVNNYQNDNLETGIFFPLIRNTINGVFNGFLNEAPWAEGLAEEAGKIDLGLLNRFNCMLPIGAVYRISIIKEYAEKKGDFYYPFKESIKISHYYEFFLRMIYEDIEGISIPRVNYEIRIKGNQETFRDYFCKIPPNFNQITIENGGYDLKETQFWMELAKKEYFYEEDRNISYESGEEK